MPLKKRLIGLFLLACIGLVLAELVVILSQQKGSQRAEDPFAQAGFDVAGIGIGGPFTLKDQSGNTVTEKDFQNTYKLIYFGFTYCPAVCPTELQKITSALHQLGPKADYITPIFISVDPERDSVEAVKTYVEFFHPSMIGLTGSSKQIDNVIKEFKVYATKVVDEDATDYTIDHSSFIYFMSPDDRLLRIYRTQDSAVDIAESLQIYFDLKAQN